MKRHHEKMYRRVTHYIVYVDGNEHAEERIAIVTTDAELDSSIEIARIFLQEKYEKEHPDSPVGVISKPHS